MTPKQTPHPLSPNRRRFIVIVPLAGGALLAACSKTSDTPAPAAAPAPAPAPTAAPAPSPSTSSEAAPAASGGGGSTAASPAPAEPTAQNTPNAPQAVAAGTMVDEKDPTAQSLGYVSDSSRADTARFKNHAPGMACANCSLYGGAAGSAEGPCPIFQGRRVAAKGWCSAYVKKTA
jgi:hypothetical protein